jgi:hypothetical protein
MDVIDIHVTREAKGIRATSCASNVILPGQTIREAARLIKENYKIVRDHYEQRSRGEIEAKDLSSISLKIVFSYLHMYNMWREFYPKEKDRDLRFIQKDFAHPQTYDIIINHFKKRDKTKYAHPCQLLMGMDAQEFEQHERARQEFFDRR